LGTKQGPDPGEEEGPLGSEGVAKIQKNPRKKLEREELLNSQSLETKKQREEGGGNWREGKKTKKLRLGNTVHLSRNREKGFHRKGKNKSEK